jgi:hypothetical protein
VITRKRVGHVGQEAIAKAGIRRQEERGKGQEARGRRQGASQISNFL